MEYKIYLAGGITGCNYGEIADWRDYVTNTFPDYIKTLSPLRGKAELSISKEKSIKDSYEDNPLTSRKGINTRDHNDVRRSDAILVNLLDAQTVSIGTVMEIAWAHAYKVPIIVARDPNNDLHDHSMINTCVGFYTDNLDEAIMIATYVVSDDKQLSEYLATTNNKFRDIFIKED